MSTATKQEIILDAYVALLYEHGAREATIDATAKRSGLSKAGLLHHFRSRQALDTELVRRLNELIDADVAAMLADPAQAVHYYFASSLEEDSPLERIVVAATRLAQRGNDQASAALRRGRDLWFQVLNDSLGDPVLAKLALLAGDGVSYHLDISRGHQDQFLTADTVKQLVQLLAQRHEPRT
ncbi:TetR/AcrR family transcriptional regulator [Glutamicibacter sp. NPDC087344]|uniref:TetR/AcrR family transcriptional regulator n=1 Tax=Glutamicibacter sp. NPDC087344 TaxID=3363994 RepID=UPI0038007B85